jgi:acyl-CoA synthetase (AMP-forming)/AMP-acid ligase II
VPGWNFADVLECVADEVPASLAVAYGDRRHTWRELMGRAGGVAAHLTAAGLPRQARVVQYLRNRPEYLESFVGTLLGAFVPVNTNYRYGPAELTYLWNDCAAEAVVFAAEFAPTIERMRDTVPHVRTWLCVDDDEGACPEWAEPYEPATATVATRPGWERSGDDLVVIYTGGTTGLPKGVMWRQDDLFVLLGNQANGRYPDAPDLGYARSRVVADGRRHLPAAPLMHGAGCLTCMPVMARGGGIVLLTGASFDPTELLDAVEREHVFSVGWVGDAFARPVLEALQSEPHRWDLASWRVVTSGGVLFSEGVKQGLIEHVPGLTIADVYGSTEAVAAARSVTSATERSTGRSFSASSHFQVLDEQDQPVRPGSGEIGRVAFTGRLPLGYLGDETKTAATFRMIDGVRHAFTGDSAQVDGDGRIVLLGRGSACINTGGEKVYPEEVEEVLMRHPDIADVAVVGVPDERFGERVAAAVQLEPGRELDTPAVIAFVKEHLASYKAPRLVVPVTLIPRGPNGKADHDALRPLVLAGAE